MLKRLMFTILILIGLAIAFQLILYFSAIPDSDFEQDYVAASRLLDGLPIYKGVNAHPPFNALFFSPLTFFTLQEAFVVLGMLSLAVLWLNALMIENGLNLKQSSAYVIFAVSLFWPATITTVCFGQSTILWTGAVTAGWLCEKRNRPIAAGIFIGLAILIKLIPALIVILWYLNRRWRAALSATMVVLAGFLLMAKLIGFDEIRYFFFTRVPENSRNFVDFYSNASISGAAEKLFGSNGGWSRSLVEIPTLSRIISVLGVAAVVLITMIIASIKLTKESNELVDYRTALVIVSMLLVSPLTWPHYFVVLLFPLTLLLRTADNDNSVKIQGKAIVLFAIILLVIPNLIEHMFSQARIPIPNFWYQQSEAIQLINLSQTIGLFMLWMLLAKKIMLLRNACLICSETGRT